MSFYERDAAYKAITTGNNPDIAAIIAGLTPADCKELAERIGREVPPLKARLDVLQEASRRAMLRGEQAS